MNVFRIYDTKLLYPGMNICDIMKAWDHSGYMQKWGEIYQTTPAETPN